VENGRRRNTENETEAIDDVFAGLLPCGMGRACVLGAKMTKALDRAAHLLKTSKKELQRKIHEAAEEYMEIKESKKPQPKPKKPERVTIIKSLDHMCPQDNWCLIQPIDPEEYYGAGLIYIPPSLQINSSRGHVVAQGPRCKRQHLLSDQLQYKGANTARQVKVEGEKPTYHLIREPDLVACFPDLKKGNDWFLLNDWVAVQPKTVNAKDDGSLIELTDVVVSVQQQKVSTGTIAAVGLSAQSDPALEVGRKCWFFRGAMELISAIDGVEYILFRADVIEMTRELGE